MISAIKNKLLVLKKLIIRDISEGSATPIFYLPVRRFVGRFGYECWIFPLAPLAILYFMFSSMFISAWKDIFYYSSFIIQNIGKNKRFVTVDEILKALTEVQFREPYSLGINYAIGIIENLKLKKLK